ncbi:protein PSK SIMULATOR 1-like [Bidens hawaiensis]|uniref:protein PSK SIMULATOR 1-like n=1 Tax=Bidens hawaiensis TaxID=980011 RepID=UPI00404B9F61
MGIDTLKESSWFTSIWKHSRKTAPLDPEKPVIGIMSFEVSRLMTKLANLWHVLSDKQMSRLQEELANSLGIRNLVSDNQDYLMQLALMEIVDNIKCVSKGVSRLGKKCTNLVYHNLDQVFDNIIEIDVNWIGWEYKFKKMDKRVKKMKRFAAVTLQLCEELEVLSELESGLKRLQDNNNSSQIKINEFEKKVMWQHEEVNGLREMSTWVRSYDHIVRLLLRSLFTIVERVKGVFVISPPDVPCLVRRNSVSALSDFPSKNSIRRWMSNLGYKQRKNVQPHPPSVFCGAHTSSTTRSLTQFGLLKKCMTSDLDSPKVNATFQTPVNIILKGWSNGQHGQTSKKPTLGDAALALHYENVIIFIERLAISPHFINLESREDLYHMLTTNIKNSLKEKLNLESKNDFSRDIASEWSSSMQKTLDWLVPLAQNMIKWHSERNFEKQTMGSGSVLLVNTLHYADQEKSEDAITNLVLGLHYVSRFGREINSKAFMGSSCDSNCDDYLFHDHIV